MSRKKPVDLATVRQARASLAKVARDFPELRAPSSKGNRARWEQALEDELTPSKKRTTQDQQLVVRLPKPLLDRVDAYAERLRDAQPGPAWRRSDVVRLLLANALDAVEKPSTKGKK